MKISFKRMSFCIALCFAFAACTDKDIKITDPDGDGDGEKPVISFTITPIEKLNQGTSVINSHADVTSRSSLKMDFRSYVNLGQGALGVSSPHYPRVKKLANGNYIMFYHNNQIGASCYYSISQNLKAWSAKGKILSNYAIIDSDNEANERRFSNCDALVLSNGDIIAVASYRANVKYREKPLDAGIVMMRSTDNGLRWSTPVEIYRGVNWEPSLLELPSGEIHCYFTDSSRTNEESNDTGTALVISKNNGQTWTPSFGSNPYYVIRTKHMKNGKTLFNNQMPVVIKLNGSNELAAAVEANIGSYNISLAYSGEDGEWDKLSVTQEGPVDRNDSAFEGCAPYIVQFPSGETVLSYNKSSTYYMKMGDARARNFGEAYAPFSGKGYWGTLERIDNHQLIGAMPNTNEGVVMLGKFVLNHDIEATPRSVSVDGGNAEWANTDHALFVGEKSQAQATLRCSFDDNNVYFLVEVLDNVLSKDDYATIHLSPVSTNTLSDKSCRIRVSLEGLKGVFTYKTDWTNTNLDVTASAKFKGDVANVSDQDHGYIVEVAVPRSKLNIESGQIRVNFSIYDKQGGLDAISNVSSTSTANWVYVKGL